MSAWKHRDLNVCVQPELARKGPRANSDISYIPHEISANIPQGHEDCSRFTAILLYKLNTRDKVKINASYVSISYTRDHTAVKIFYTYGNIKNHEFQRTEQNLLIRRIWSLWRNG